MKLCKPEYNLLHRGIFDRLSCNSKEHFQFPFHPWLNLRIEFNIDALSEFQAIA